MLSLILGVVGSPSYQDILDMTEDRPMRQALREIPLAPVAPISLARKYPASPDGAIDLLRRMLVLNPKTRLTTRDCLSHPWMALDAHGGGGIELDHGVAMSFPFEETQQTTASLRRLMLLEVDLCEAQNHALEASDELAGSAPPEIRK